MAKTHEQYVKELSIKNSEVEVIGKYIGSTNYIKVRCKRCGNEWEAKAYSLLQGRGCPKCKVARGVKNNHGKTQKKTHEQFASELNKIDNTITLKSNYISHHNNIRCLCKRCGNEWEAKAYSLLQGHGCPRCTKSGTSFMEQFIRISFVRALSEKDVISRDRKTIGMELDIVIPKYKIAIEPGNWFLHRKNIDRDKKKRELCSKKGIRLITIYDKFPKDEKEPFMKDCIVFNDDYNKSDHKEIIKLVKILFEECNMNCNFDKQEWERIEEQSYLLSKSKTHKDFIQEMKKVNSHIKIIGEYKNANRRVRVKCLKCGYEWNGVPANMIRGDGCRKCGTIKAHKKLMKDKDELIKELARKNPDVEAIGEYTGRHSKIKTKCKICGYEWKPVVSSLLRGSSHRNHKKMHKTS